jgi:hypothetical protein
MDATDLARLETWGAQYPATPPVPSGPKSTATDINAAPVTTDQGAGFVVAPMHVPSEVKFEAGLRVCPRCKKPVHLGAAICRECGTSVPRQ